MKEYCLSGFQSADNYSEFINYMVNKSDYFSLVYYKAQENEKMKKSTRMIHDQLKSFKHKSFFTNMWPNMFTLNQSQDIYKVVLYRCDAKATDVLTTVNDIFDWNYPTYPMDLCFYRNERCWMSSSAHENLAFIYTDDDKEASEIKAFNATISYERNVDEKKLFWLSDFKSGFCEQPYWQR